MLGQSLIISLYAQNVYCNHFLQSKSTITPLKGYSVQVNRHTRTHTHTHRHTYTHTQLYLKGHLFQAAGRACSQSGSKWLHKWSLAHRRLNKYRTQQLWPCPQSKCMMKHLKLLPLPFARLTIYLVGCLKFCKATAGVQMLNKSGAGGRLCLRALPAVEEGRTCITAFQLKSSHMVIILHSFYFTFQLVNFKPACFPLN